MKDKDSYKERLSELQTIAESRNGKCLSNEYRGLKVKLNWQCDEGHQWRASPTSIIFCKSWCPVCAGNQKLTIDTIRDIAIINGGKCLSEKYLNSKHKILWECHKGHQWLASTFSIKIRGSWCPSCFINSKKIQL